MKILHVASEYPPAQIYGLGRFVHGLACAQAEQGDDVLVLTNSHGGEEDAVLQDGVHVHRIAFPNPPRPPSGQGEVLQWGHGVVSRFLERREAFADVELVCGHDWLTALSVREIAADLGVPLVVTVHDEVTGKRFGAPSGPDGFVRALEALTVHDAGHVIANSAYVAEQVVARYGVVPARVTAVHGGITPSLFEVEDDLVREVRAELAGPDDSLVLYVGRLDAEKGVSVLADAAQFLRDACPGLRLAIAGTGGLEASLRSRLGSLGDRARLLGYVAGPRLSALYRAADVVCVPSLYEPFGLVALEAMVAGTPVVAARTGGLAEIVRHERDGLLVPPGDALFLADALASLVRDPKRARAFGRSGAERARSVFSWGRIAAQTREVYRQVLSRPRHVCVSPPRPPAPQLVSAVVLVEGLQVDLAEETVRSLLEDTNYSALEVLLAPTGLGADEQASLMGLVASTAEKGAAVTLLPAAPSSARALSEGIRGARGEHVCLLGAGVVVPEGSESWLSGLVWLLESEGAVTASPRLRGREAGEDTLAAGVPALGQGPWASGCLLARRSSFTEAPLPESEARPVDAWADALTGAHWQHPLCLDLASPPSQAPAASVVLVASGGLRDTRAAVAALRSETRAPYELILVDNGSRDGTRAFFHEVRREVEGSLPVQVIENPENLGYPKAANQGIRAARAPHVVLLNNDAQVRAGWLTALLDAARCAPRVGVVTAKILNPDGTVQNAGGILHHPDGRFTVPHAGEDRLAPSVIERRAVESASGPCMLLTRALLDEVGLFDEAYSPAYYEDSDLCMRARQADFLLLYEPGAEVVHKAQSTSIRLVREGKLDLDRVLRDNKARFYRRWRRELIEDEASRRLLDVAGEIARHRILLCYGESDTTTAAYCEAALREAHEVVVAGPGQELDLGRGASARELCAAGGGGFDLLLCVEGENSFPERLEDAPCQTAVWLIDNHLHARDRSGWHLDVAGSFGHVFVAQRDHLPVFWEQGIPASWLPLACAPAVHAGPSVEKDLDVVFVGNVRAFHKRRRALLDRLKKRFAVHEASGVYREAMAERFSRAKIVFNCSLAGDLNMRVFEALASGSLLLTDRIENGLPRLLGDREHLVLYDDDSLESLVDHYLADDAAREEIADRGSRLARTHHTYRERMDSLLRVVRDAAREAAREEYAA